MSTRLRGIATETERIVAAGGYMGPNGRDIALREAIAHAVRSTRLHGPEPVALPAADTGGAAGERPLFEVTAESSLEAARRLTAAPEDDPAGGDRVAVLNFSSARNPGGDYLNDAQAQEEALCRASALYVCLREAPEFHAAHRADHSPFYTDRVIRSPGVPVFRDGRGRLLAVPYRAGFLTSPAPNAGVIARQLPPETGRILQALNRRAERVLEVAARYGYRRLILGAWGCGVFRNDPAQVAVAFAVHLTGTGRFHDCFTHVVFAVLDRRPGSPIRTTFTTAFPTP